MLILLVELTAFGGRLLLCLTLLIRDTVVTKMPLCTELLWT